MPLSHRAVGLVLQYRIQLIRCEPRTHFRVAGSYCTGDGMLHDPDQHATFHIAPWTDHEWAGFRNNFVNVICRHWDNKFELVPNRAWYSEDGSSAPTDAAVQCHLSIELVNTAAAAHHRYYIVKPVETTLRSFADATGRVALLTHRDLGSDWSAWQARVGRERRSVSFAQSTALHEFGHTLGLWHVNGRGNNDAAYGVTLEELTDLMGVGDHLTARHASPWSSQLRRHHLIVGHNQQDAALRFTARVTAPQLVTYWDNDWRPPAGARRAE